MLRVLFGLRADGFWTNSGTAGQTDLLASMSNQIAFGIVTTIGPGSETPPSPMAHPNDVAPPTQRWLFRAEMSMRLTSFSGASSTYTLTTGDQWEKNETEGQVLATGFAAPNHLNVWLSIDTVVGNWSTPTPGDQAWYTAWWSVLLKQ
ncbi:MAG TPA: hypothetical protein VF748_14880 [Candidatus Acidoferrum sp.]